MDKNGALQFCLQDRGPNDFCFKINDHALDPANPFMFKKLSWKNDPLFKRIPCVEDIKQTSIGNCYLLAALLAIVEKAPYYINDLMQDNGDGTVTVRLYDHGIRNYITIEKTIYCGVFARVIQPQATWVYMIEKAYAALRIRSMRYFYRTRTGHYRRPNNISEALSGGWAHESFNILLNTQSTKLNIIHEGYYSENIDIALDHSKTNPYTFLHDVLTYNKDNPTSSQPVAGLNRIFGYSGAIAKRDFINSTSDVSHLAFKIYFKENYIIRMEALCSLVTKIFPHLQAETAHKLLNYIDQHSPRKRGTRNYIHNQNRYYDVIYHALRDGHMICLSTKNNIGIEKKLIGEDKTDLVKGLVATHAYQVINCYQRAGLKFILLRNPWKYYVRGYKEIADRNILSAYGLKKTPPRISDQRPISDKAIEFPKPINELYAEPGTFELELSNLSKRFRRIDIGHMPW